MDVVLVEKKDKVGIVTINRPESANALNRKLFTRLREALLSLDGDKNVYAVILTGAGEKVFCSGLDLKERNSMTEEDIEYSRRFEVFPLYFDLDRLETPVIAAINGAAIAGGAEIALACDIRIASDNASFGLGEVKWGIIPAGGAIQWLPLIAGMGVAKELILTARIIDAERAEELRIFNHVVPSSQLMSKAMSIAEELIQNSPLALRQAKRSLNFKAAVSHGITYDIEASKVCYVSADRKEGTSAFSEKRKPDWKSA
jgi:enoyl-CoA hydratase/carnithine racemase